MIRAKIHDARAGIFQKYAKFEAVILALNPKDWWNLQVELDGARPAVYLEFPVALTLEETSYMLYIVDGFVYKVTLS